MERVDEKQEKTSYSKTGEKLLGENLLGENLLLNRRKPPTQQEKISCTSIYNTLIHKYIPDCTVKGISEVTCF